MIKKSKTHFVAALSAIKPASKKFWPPLFYRIVANGHIFLPQLWQT
jgi:hypothetical protein